ncbi:MAG: hypothetical protein ACRDPO_14490 [Streptosporangiaceae bacterium]
MPAAGSRPVVIIGNLTIDDVIQPDGSSQMETLGGNCVHACAAALTWTAGVGVVARCGTDFPARALARLREAGADTAGIRDIDGPTVRNWVIYEADGSRHWVYRTPPGRSAEVAPQPGDIPEAWLTGDPAPVVHVAAMPLAAAGRDRGRGPQAGPGGDHHAGHARGLAVRRRGHRGGPAGRRVPALARGTGRVPRLRRPAARRRGAHRPGRAVRGGQDGR